MLPTLVSAVAASAAVVAPHTSGMTGPMWRPAVPPGALRLLAIHPQPLPVMPVLCVVLAAAYGCGVWRMHRRGHGWPPGRSVSWAAGLVSILAVTATGVGGYGMTLFSVHMAQHMVLSMLSPILLLMGAPVTLALRALPAGGGTADPPRVAARPGQPTGRDPDLPGGHPRRCSSPASTGCTSPRCSTRPCAPGGATPGCCCTSWWSGCCSSGRSWPSTRARTAPRR